MFIIFDTLEEFAKARVKCEETRNASKCEYCPFAEDCECDNDENIHIMCCTITDIEERGIAKIGGVAE